ncbi:MAG: ABC transporter permease subunit [Lachnospiraceae bacterium]|nr:ABC transporter permease subunit [Lachnospiraceae bacterium]
MKLFSKCIKYLSGLSCILVTGLILFLFGFIFYRGAGVISVKFLTDVPKGAIIGSEGGILPAIIGSLMYTGTALLTAAVPSFSLALYQVYYQKNRLGRTFFKIIIQCISGIPSIVFGMFGYSFLVLFLGWGRCILSGGVTLGLMIIPFIEIRLENAMRQQPALLAEQSAALGVSSFYMIRHLIIPCIFPEIISAFLLGGCYAMGAAAPLIFTGAVVNAPVTTDLMSPAMALPNHLHSLLTQGISTENAYGTAFVLMLLVLVVNLGSTFYARRRSLKWKTRKI